MRYRRRKKRVSSNLLLFLVPMFIVLNMVMINTFAKYYTSWQLDEAKSVTSQTCNFFGDEFSSRSISSAEPIIVFGIRNYDSNGVYTTSNITYSMSIKDSNSETVSGLTIQPAFTNGIRTISGGSANEDIIKITGFPDGITNKQYKITISMSAPYEKALDEVTYTVTHLPDIASESVDYNSNPPYIVRKIQTNDFAGTKSYTLNWNTSTEYPDPTDPYVGGFTGSSGTITLSPNSTYNLRFISLT